ncbi:hypothetical protein EI427_12890 [Flammeovirga pectinis]|uniref:Uncharacterized protein n=1 Tax=Flammeovirga pectinis TaxID=2494373 RepID=A0A3S9P4I3_9BACT|nr:hypothetical protein [Flammeovirga pectinis]AZQ63101.1 hypothetical protein EI427_12890 [Flammeovirga pectinis]
MTNLRSYLIGLISMCLIFSCTVEEEEPLTDGLATYNDSEGIEFFAEWKVGDATITESVDIEYLFLEAYHENDVDSDGEFTEATVSGYAEYKKYIGKQLRDGVYTIKISCSYDVSERIDYTVYLQGQSISKDPVTKEGYFLEGDSNLEIKAFRLVKDGNNYTIYN